MGSCPSQKKKDADGKGHKISKNLLKLATNKNVLGPVPRNILGLEFVQCSKFPQLHFLSVIQWNLWSGGCAFRIHHQEAEKGRRGMVVHCLFPPFGSVPDDDADIQTESSHLT